VRLPEHVVDMLVSLGRARDTLVQRSGEDPSSHELAAEMGIPVGKVDWLLEIGSLGTRSLDMPVGEEGGHLGDFIEDRSMPEPEELADAAFLREHVDRALGVLSDRERRVIELRFGLGGQPCRTLEEVGVELDLTKERIRQIENEALSRLRRLSSSWPLRDYL